MLADYEQIQPGFADRIIKMAEAEQAHRHQSQCRILKDLSNDLKVQHNLNSIGLITGFILSALGLWAVAYMATHGAQTSAGITVTALVSLALIFVLRRKPKTESKPELPTDVKVK